MPGAVLFLRLMLGEWEKGDRIWNKGRLGEGKRGNEADKGNKEKLEISIRKEGLAGAQNIRYYFEIRAGGAP